MNQVDLLLVAKRVSRLICLYFSDGLMLFSPIQSNLIQFNPVQRNGILMSKRAIIKPLTSIPLLMCALTACVGGGDKALSSSSDFAASSSAAVVSSGVSVSSSLQASSIASVSSAAPSAISLKLQADVNRDGLLNAQDDDAAKQASLGVIVLPNIDDDGLRCGDFEERFDGYLRENNAYIRCNDAADEVSNGEQDIADLTRIKIMAIPGLLGSATVKASISHKTLSNMTDKFRILAQRGNQFVDIQKQALTVADVKAGIDLAVEAKDVLRNPTEWDGTGTLTVELAVGNDIYTDDMPLVVAPIITQHDGARVSEVIIATRDYGNNPGPITQELTYKNIDLQFMADLTNITQDFVNELVHLKDAEGDRWAQDLFEPAFVAKPTADGVQLIRIALRSANQTSYLPDWKVLPRFQNMSDKDILDELNALSDDDYYALYDQAVDSPDNTLVFREAGAALYSELRGADMGVVQIEKQYMDNLPKEVEDTFNSTGNFTTSPPQAIAGANYPRGRMIYGATPNPRFITLLEAQGLQPTINLPTQWLEVGHVDEVISFLPSTINPRGWVVAIADPNLAEEVIRNAQQRSSGSTMVLPNRVSLNSDENKPNIIHERTISALLSDQRVTLAKEIANENIAKIITILKRELALNDDDFVRVPVMFTLPGDVALPAPNASSNNAYLVSSYFPNAVNGLYLGNYQFVAPMQFGPVIQGEDAMQTAVQNVLAPHGVDVRWINDFNYAHLGVGNVHCVTNSFRDLTDVSQWW